jgi:hypothetical protein
MKDGREFYAYIDVAKGHPLAKPLSQEEIEEKFRDNVAFSKTVSKENAEKVLYMLNNLEEIDDITGLVKLLIA